MALAGAFTLVLGKHSKSFSLIDCIAVGVDRMQRNFEPMRKVWRRGRGLNSPTVTAKVVIYEAFVEGKLEVPRHLGRTVLYFEPKCGRRFRRPVVNRGDVPPPIDADVLS